ncbi:MAG: hypothetical protein MZW92_78460 [Comamonadaceae bacterium]|nr:hypothetical protein [Comamonadaceae bacterium]
MSDGPYASLNLAAHVGDDAERGGRESTAAARSRAPARRTRCGSSRCTARDVARHPRRVAGRCPRATRAVAFEPRPRLRGDDGRLPAGGLRRTGAARGVGVAHAGWRGLARAASSRPPIAALEATPDDLRRLARAGASGRTRSRSAPKCAAAFCRPQPGGCGSVLPPQRTRPLPGRPVRRSRGSCSPRRASSAVHGGGWCTYREARAFLLVPPRRRRPAAWRRSRGSA